MTNPKLIKNLYSHRGAINAIDFDDKFILSASGDRSLIVFFFTLYFFNYLAVGCK